MVSFQAAVIVDWSVVITIGIVVTADQLAAINFHAPITAQA